MIKEEGHYTLKRVKKLPKMGNSNLLYIIIGSTIDKLYRWLPNKTYEVLTIGSSSSGGSQSTNTSDLVNDGENGSDPFVSQSDIPEYSINPISGTNQINLLKDGVPVSTIDLSPYLDDTNLARLVNGSLNSSTGIATFTRDDNTTFTVDFSDLLSTLTASNGLTITGSDIKLGGLLTEDTVINLNGNRLIFTDPSIGDFLDIDSGTFRIQGFDNTVIDNTNNLTLLAQNTVLNTDNNLSINTTGNSTLFTSGFTNIVSTGINLQSNGPGIFTLNTVYGTITLDSFNDGFRFSAPEIALLSGGGTPSAGDVWTAKGPDGKGEWITPSASGSGGALEVIDEGNGDGIVIVGRDSNNYGNVGLGSIDLTTSDSSSTTKGVTGDSSFGFGDNSTVTGNNAIGIGGNSTVVSDFGISIGDNNFVENDFTPIALGRLITSVGTSSIGIGYSNQATSDGSIAIGTSVLSRSVGSIALGNNSEVGLSSQDGIAIGTNSLASGSAISIGRDAGVNNSFQSVSIGNLARANAQQTIAIGPNSTTSSFSQGGVAIGWASTANSNNDIAIGRGANATGSSTIALGFSTRTFGDSSVAIGNDATIRNAVSSTGRAIAIGHTTTNGGSRSISIGSDSVVSDFASNAIAIGQFSNAQAQYSVAIGSENVAYSFGEVSLGLYGTVYIPSSTSTSVNTDRLLNVGNGTNPASKSDAFTILKNGASILHPIDISTITSPVAGMLITDSSDNNRLKHYDGTQWNNLY